ncbi:hypothetical protein MVLG_05938 [Microbotryum lychnidis-dioicae p1A1 Lamole]|uniref:Uncharacterized protein n=1 Tax=Microbotryum lychnidis-dioicae (strain p1A1 Lamole / MvSl-1064) TaxID=683840 RepID=U5HFR2_USTV1|nr:hypothetical protein MVLG_05938 [Microbotryum lychnidis-dioicae p1A1 Lamole]|eukprot:KDE03603.1 hypothetical protein MVLG_05938 [Microbotryum lychnidis-dioicae p1A1 Lamole]
MANPWKDGGHSSSVKIGKTSRLWIRSVANEEGIGSTLQRIKGGTILSIFFDSTFVLGETLSEHGYYHDEVLNPKAFGALGVEAWQVPAGRICRISDYLPQSHRDAVARGCQRVYYCFIPLGFPNMISY